MSNTPGQGNKAIIKLGKLFYGGMTTDTSMEFLSSEENERVVYGIANALADHQNCTGNDPIRIAGLACEESNYHSEALTCFILSGDKEPLRKNLTNKELGELTHNGAIDLYVLVQVSLKTLAECDASDLEYHLISEIVGKAGHGYIDNLKYTVAGVKDGDVVLQVTASLVK